MKITSIIDAHTHLPVTPEDLPGKREALLSEMKRNGISKAVVIADSEQISAIGNTSECVSLFASTPEIAVIAGISPFIEYADQLALLKGYAAEQKIAGIKLYCGHEPIYLNDPVLALVYRLAGEYHLPVLFHSGWDNAHYSAPAVIAEAADRYPHLQFVCCHCCYPDLSGCFERLAFYQNVYFDISSVADGETDDLKPVLEKAIHQMPDRFLFGSDWGSCSQEKHLRFAMSLQIAASEKEKLFYKNAEALYFTK